MLTEHDISYLNELMFRFDSATCREDKIKVLESIQHENQEIENYLLRLVLFAEGDL